MNLLFLDTETTGFTHNRLIQLAWEHHPTGERCMEYFLPTEPIEEGAEKVHGISMESLKDKLLFPGSDHFYDLQDLAKESIVVCHNADYDLKVLAQEGIVPAQHICTCKVARHVLRGEPNHKLQDLKDRIGFPVPDEDLKAHDALGDVMVMIGLFAHMLKIQQDIGITDDETIAKWLEISNGIPETMPFGKHRGKKIIDLPTDYISWVLQQDDFDKSIFKSIKHYLPHLI